MFTSLYILYTIVYLIYISHYNIYLVYVFTLMYLHYLNVSVSAYIGILWYPYILHVVPYTLHTTP